MKNLAKALVRISKPLNFNSRYLFSNAQIKLGTYYLNQLNKMFKMNYKKKQIMNQRILFQIKKFQYFLKYKKTIKNLRFEIIDEKDKNKVKFFKT